MEKTPGATNINQPNVRKGNLETEVVVGEEDQTVGPKQASMNEKQKVGGHV